MAISRQDRAKQFMAFDALKGLMEALHKKEEQYIERKELSEDVQEQISRRLKTIETGERVKITYYNKGQYKEISGTVMEIDFENKKIILGNSIEVKFEDVYSV